MADTLFFLFPQYTERRGSNDQEPPTRKCPDCHGVVRPHQPTAKQPRGFAASARRAEKLAEQTEADGQRSVAPTRLALPLLTYMSLSYPAEIGSCELSWSFADLVSVHELFLTLYMTLCCFDLHTCEDLLCIDYACAAPCMSTCMLCKDVPCPLYIIRLHERISSIPPASLDFYFSLCFCNW